MDPLLALRQAISSQSPITYLNENNEPCDTLQQATWLLFSPDVKISKVAPTRFQKPNASTRDWVGHPEDFFAVQAVLLVWLTRGAPGGEYLKQAREMFAGTGFVSVTDRKPLVEWLEGTLDTLERIIPTQGLCRITSECGRGPIIFLMCTLTRSFGWSCDGGETTLCNRPQGCPCCEKDSCW